MAKKIGYSTIDFFLKNSISLNIFSTREDRTVKKVCRRKYLISPSKKIIVRPLAVFSSCSFILDTHFGKVWRQSVAMEICGEAIFE